MSDVIDSGSIIRAVVVDTQFAQQLTAEGVQVPDLAQLVTVTALVVKGDGTPAPENTPVYWTTDPSDGSFQFYRIGPDGRPEIISDPNNPDYPSPSPNMITTYTDSDGQTSVFAGCINMVIGMVFADLHPTKWDNFMQVPDEDRGFLHGPKYQYVAAATFDNQGALHVPTGFRVDDEDKVYLTSLDGSENPPRQSGTINNDTPLAPDNDPNPPLKGSRLMFWGLSGDDNTGVGQIAGGIDTNWNGKRLKGPYPYSMFSSKNNSVAYMFYGGSMPSYSKIYTFDMEGVPLARPDDIANSDEYAQSLPVVQFVQPRPDVRGNPVVQDLPATIDLGSFNKQTGKISWAIAAPPNFDPQKNRGDIIDIALYWNGWATDEEEMQTWIYRLRKKGSDFVENYTSDGGTYLPFFLPKTFCLGFGLNPTYGWKGYFWAAYTYNTINIARPASARLNLPGKRTLPPSFRTLQES